ncbi:hypothetical protein LINPERHAP2_LOCUS26174 [Linum perenne]
MIVQLGEVQPVLVYWLRPGTNVSYGLIPLNCDNDVLLMVEKLTIGKIVQLYARRIEENGVNDRSVDGVDHGNAEDEDDDDDYYPETDSDESIVFEDDQIDPFEDEDIRDRLYKDVPCENTDQPAPIVNSRVTRSKSKGKSRQLRNEDEMREAENHRRRFQDFNQRTDMDRPEFEVGISFKGGCIGNGSWGRWPTIREAL